MMYQVIVERRINKPIGVVFEMLTNHANYAQFPGIVSSKLLEPGEHETNGLGALRFVDAGKMQLEERIISFERPTRFTYYIESSKPYFIDLEKGEVLLSEDGDATLVRWESKGRIKVPLVGPLMDKLFQNQFAKGFGAILKYVDKA